MGVPLAHNNIPTTRRASRVTRVFGLLVFLCICLSYLIGRQFYTVNFRLDVQRRTELPRFYKCKPPLPKLLQRHPPTLNEHPSLRWAAIKLDAQLAARAALPGTDSLVLTVVTPAGVLWSKGYGRRHANETGNTASPDLDTSYRIASISKIFATLETLILRGRGALNLDDPVIKFLPNFTHRAIGWKEYLNGAGQRELEYNTSITLRQLASHMSGIGRDYPPFDIPSWPPLTTPDNSRLQGHLMPSPTPPWANSEEMRQAIARYPLTVPSYSYPTYSNAGFGVLGWCNVAAAKQLNKTSANTYAGLLQRDIFTPLHMTGSSFLASDLPGDRLAFPSIGDEIDWDLGEGMNPAGGQFSSARDLAKVMQMLLDPSKRNSLVSPLVMREWLRSMHAWSDEINEVGMPWEITKLPDSNGRPQRWYGKAGTLPMSRSLFSFNPAISFGVIALHNGVYGDMQYFVKKAIDAFWPVFEKILEDRTRRQYGGTWVAKDSEVVLTVSDGSLWVTKMIVKGKNVLSGFWGTDRISEPLTLWSTEREDEFRIAFGRPGVNSLPLMGCTPYWITMDGYYSHGAPLDLLYFEGSGVDRVMHYPSMEATLRRP